MAKEKLIKNAIYKIAWTDTNGRLGWYDEGSIDVETKKVETLNHTTGFFIKESGSFYVFSMTYCPVESFAPYGMVKWIPIKTIKKIKKL